jgi:hypothetical protein
MNGKKLYLRMAMLAVSLTVIAASNQPAQAISGCGTNHAFCIGEQGGFQGTGRCEFGNCYCRLSDGTRFYDPIDCSAPIP